MKTKWEKSNSIQSVFFHFSWFLVFSLFSGFFKNFFFSFFHAGIGNKKENVHKSRLVQTKRAEKLVIHFGWLTSKTKREQVEDDIALIKTETPFRFDSCVQPACLPNPNFAQTGQPLVGSICWITGFGESQGTTQCEKTFKNGLISKN